MEYQAHFRISNLELSYANACTIWHNNVLSFPIRTSWYFQAHQAHYSLLGLLLGYDILVRSLRSSTILGFFALSFRRGLPGHTLWFVASFFVIYSSLSDTMIGKFH